MLSSTLIVASKSVFKRLGPTPWSLLGCRRQVSTCRVAQSLKRTPTSNLRMGLMPQTWFRSFERRIDNVPRDFDLIYRIDKIGMLGAMQAIQPMLLVAGFYTFFSAPKECDDISFVTINVSQTQLFFVGAYVLTIAGFLHVSLNRLVLRIYYNEDEDLFYMIHYHPLIPLKTRRQLLEPGCLKVLANDSNLHWLSGSHQILPNEGKITLNRELFRSPHLYRLMLKDGVP